MGDACYKANVGTSDESGELQLTPLVNNPTANIFNTKVLNDDGGLGIAFADRGFAAYRGWHEQHSHDR